MTDKHPKSPTLSPSAPTVDSPDVDAHDLGDILTDTTTRVAKVVHDTEEEKDEPKSTRLMPIASHKHKSYHKSLSRNWPDDDDDPSFKGPFEMTLEDLDPTELFRLDSAYPIHSIYRDPFPKGSLAAKAKAARDFISDVLFGIKNEKSDRGVVMKRFNVKNLTNVQNNFRPLPLMFDTILGLREHDYVKRGAMRKALDCIGSSLGRNQRQVPVAVDGQPRPRVRTHIYAPISVYVMKAWRGLEEYDLDHLSTAESLDLLKGRPAPNSKTKPKGPDTDKASDIDGVSYQKQEIEKFKNQIGDNSIRFHIFPIYVPTTHGDDKWMIFIYDNRETNRIQLTSKHKHTLGQRKGRYLHVVGYEEDVEYLWTASFARAIERTLKFLLIDTVVNEVTHIYPLSDKPDFYDDPICYSHTGPLIIYTVTRVLTLIEDVCQSNASFLRHAKEILRRPDDDDALGNGDWSEMLREHTRQLVQDFDSNHDLRGNERPNMPDSFYTMLYDFINMDNRPGAKAQVYDELIRPQEVKLAMYHNADAYLIGQYKLPEDKPDTSIRRFRGVPLQKGSIVLLEGPEETSDEFEKVLEEVVELLIARQDEITLGDYERGKKTLIGTDKSILALYVDEYCETWIIANNCVDSKWHVNGHKVSMSDLMGPLPSVTYISNDDLKLVNGKSTFQWIFLQRYDSEQEHQEYASFGKAPREVLQNNFGQLWAPQNQDALKRESTHVWHHHHRPVAKEDMHLNHLWKLHTNDVVQCSNWRCYPNDVLSCEGTINNAQHPRNDLLGSFAGSKFHDCKHDDCSSLGHRDEDDLVLPEGVVIYQPYLRNSRHLKIQAGQFIDEGGRIEGTSKLFHPPKTFMPIGFQSQDYWHGFDVKEKMAKSGVELYGNPQTGILFDFRGISNIRIKRQQLWNSLPERRQMQIWFEDMDQAGDNRNTIIGERYPKHTSKGWYDSRLGPNPDMNIKYTDAVDPFFESEFGVDNVVVNPNTSCVEKVYNRRKYQRNLFDKDEEFVQQVSHCRPQTSGDMEPCDVIPTYGEEEGCEIDQFDEGSEIFSRKFHTQYNKLVKEWIQRQWYNAHVLEEARHKSNTQGGGLHQGKPSKTLDLWKRDLLHQWNTLIHAQKRTHTPKLGLAEIDHHHRAAIEAAVSTTPAAPVAPVAPPGPAGPADPAAPIAPVALATPESTAEGGLDKLSFKKRLCHLQNHATIPLQDAIGSNVNTAFFGDKNYKYFKSTIAGAVENSIRVSNQGLSKVQNPDVLQKCNPKTSYYDDNLLMEPEPISAHFPLTVMTERFVTTRSTNLDTIISPDVCIKVTKDCNPVRLVPAVTFPKREVILVRDVGTNLPERSVNLKRQLGPEEDLATESPKKIAKID